MTATRTKKWVKASKSILDKLAISLGESNNFAVITMNYSIFPTISLEVAVDNTLAVVYELSKSTFRKLENEISHSPDPDKVALYKMAMKELSHVAKSYNQGHLPKV